MKAGTHFLNLQLVVEAVLQVGNYLVRRGFVDQHVAGNVDTVFFVADG